MRLISLLFLTFAFAACGPTAIDDCRANCAGCCTAEGNCEFGTGPVFCGARGTQCLTCFAGQVCQLGICVNGPVSSCTGCTQGSSCLPGTADDACGTSGTCAVCGPNERCTSGRCTLLDGGLPEVDAGSDGGEVDAGTEDAGTPDAGDIDAGTIDAGPLDAGQTDAGMRVCASGDDCTASYVNGGCCAAYPSCRGTTASSLLKCRASCGGATVACTSTADCCSGLSCQSGTCQVAQADAGTPVDAGTTMDGGAVITSCVGISCTTFNECCSNATYCRGATAGAAPTCQATPGSSGQRCTNNGDCASGLTCNSGVCGLPPCRGSGTSCTDASQCCSSAPYCTGSIYSPATKCSPARGEQGAPCVDLTDCYAPNSCVQGFCQEVDFNCRMLHQSCQSAFACCDGVSGPGELWCAPGGACYPLACGGPNDLCPGGAENSGCCSGLVCFGGLCKPPQTVQCDGAGEACLLDTCCSGLFCNSHSGNCEVPQTGCGQLYSSCTSSSQCCTSTGLFCNNGICDYGTACRITGQSCSGGEPCCSGLSCSSSGSCQPSSTCRLSGASCSATSPCCSGLTCSGGTCQTQTSCRSSGQTCGGATQCCNQLACTNGVCQSAPTCGAAGTSCSSASECCSSARFCRGSSATSANACTSTCAPNGVKAASQGDCCAGLSIDSSGVCRSAPSCLSSGASCLSSATPCCSSAPYCRASTSTGAPVCAATCAGDGMRAKSAADCCAGTTFDGAVCRAPPSCKSSGQTCNGASECCSNVPYCGASTTNQLWTCRSSCVPRLGSASSTNDCCPGLVKNSAGWCDTPCGGPGTSCSNNGACCSLSCHPTQFVCN